MNAFRQLRCGLWAALLGTAAAAAAEPALLTVGTGEAWVREFFPPSGEKEIDRIVWTNPPAQLDLDTLQVWNVRRPWPIRAWRWRDVAPAALAAPAADAAAAVVWQPRRAPAAPAPQALEIELAEPLSHAMGHSLTYRLPDFRWEAFYRVVVRGIGPQSIEAVQVDLTGYLRIHNGTSARYPHARISLVGADAALQPPPKPFGLLAVNPDSPLTDLFRAPPAPEPLVPATYPLQTEAAVPADGQAEIQFARVVRKPAQIEHVCDSAAIPSPTPPGGLPLRRVLLIPNSAAMGLGFPLPPGSADMFLGAARGAPFQSGRVAHVPFPGTVQLDLGPVDAVRASRQTGEEKALPEGAAEVECRIALDNALASPVHVRVEEKPATPRQWSLVRSSVPCTETTGALRFELTLPAQAAKTIVYRLRLAAPET